MFNSQDDSGVYKWLDGWPVFYTNWGTNEPSMGDGEGCVRLTNRPEWQDSGCANAHPFICKLSFGM